MLSALHTFWAFCRLLFVHLTSPIEALDVFLPNLQQPATESRFWPTRDIPRLTDKVVLVTGGNAGIGFETVLQLARHEPKHIYLAARTASKAAEAIEKVRRDSGFGSISWLPLDLTSTDSIRVAAETVSRDSHRLDILVLNAGVMATQTGETDQGHDIQIGTNHIGHFLLTKLLLPRLLDTARLPNSDVRVISVASAACDMAPSLDTILSKERLNRADPWTRYGASKAANILFAAELARRYPMLTSVSVHPGLVMTDLYGPGANDSLLVTAVLRITHRAFVSVHEGALTQLWAAAGAKREEMKNGQYYTPYGNVRQCRWASDVGMGIKLWEWTDRAVSRGH